MADPTLLTLFQELMASYDSTISTESGSAFRTSVIDPLLNRIGDSPLDVDLETYLVDRLKTEHPTLDTSEGSGIRDLVIRPMVTMLSPIRREINEIAVAQSLNNYEQMTRAEVDALLGNFFLSVQQGTLATGTVRAYFSVPQAAVIDSLVKFSTADGLNFFPSSIVSITATTMSLNRDAGLYYVDVPCQAESNGTEYNIAAGKITKVETIIGAVKVTNLIGFQSGVADETKATAVTRAKTSITTRTLATSRGISTLITDQFANIDTLQVIGFGDAEMERDVIEGPQTISGIPGGFFGAADADTTANVHIGGKTDVYVYQPSRSDQTLDIKNITDTGRRVVRGANGSSPSSGSLNTFEDLGGQFVKNGVKPGDILRLGSDSVSLIETEILSLSETILLTNTGTVPLGLASQTYEVIRKEDTGLYVDVSLHDLAAVDSSGNTILEGTTPVTPIPGDLSLGALTLGGTNQVKTVNIASENIKTPFMRVSSVEQLDPTQFTLTGVTYPHSDPLFAESVSTFSGGTDPVAAVGSIRFNTTKGAGASIGDGDFAQFTGSEGIAQRFVFTHTGSYTLTTSNAFYAQGSITCCPPTEIFDGQVVVINDGSNAYTFYFDKSGTYTPTTVDAYNIEVDISSTTTDAEVAAALSAQINVATINITPLLIGNVVNLTHDTLGAAAGQNTRITYTIASTNFSVKGMLGGTVLVDISASSNAYDIAAAFRTALIANNLDVTPGPAPTTGDATVSLTNDFVGSGITPFAGSSESGFANEIQIFGLTEGDTGTKATGSIRVYFMGAVGAFFPSDTTSAFTKTTFTDSGGRTFTPTSKGSVAASYVGSSNTFTSSANTTSILTRGTWVAEVTTGANLFMLGTAATPSVYDSGTNTTTTTVRYDDTGSAYATSSTKTLKIYQGANYQDVQQDSVTGLYYIDVAVQADSVGSSYNASDTEVFTTSNIYSEGWAIRNIEAGQAFSTREKPFIRFSNYVNDLNFRKTSAAYAVRLAYEYADTLSEVQTFVESDDNRIVAEDVLVKHFLPGIVTAKITLSGITAAQASAAVSSFLSTLSPSTTLEVSDIVDQLYSAGATYVQLPITLVVKTPSQGRVFTGLTTKNTVPLERIRHFLLESDGLTVTVST